MTRLLKYWPKGRVFDFVLNLLLFVYSHHRLPTRKWNFSDQIFWQKCHVKYNLSPLVTLTSDKHLMKVFVSHTIGEKYCIPTLEIIETNKLDGSVYYDQDVILKPRHLSGFFSFASAGELVNLSDHRKNCLRNHYDFFREINYKYLPKGLIVEPILYGNRNLNDIKLFFFNSTLIFIQVDSNRDSDHKRLLFDNQFCSLDLSLKYPVDRELELPANVLEIHDAVSPIAAFFHGWVRIDCYTDSSDIKVGEITHCHGSSLERVVPSEKLTVFEQYLRREMSVN